MNSKVTVKSPIFFGAGADSKHNIRGVINIFVENLCKKIIDTNYSHIFVITFRSINPLNRKHLFGFFIHTMVTWHNASRDTTFSATVFAYSGLFSDSQLLPLVRFLKIKDCERYYTS